MELTKRGHACVVLTEADRRLVVDPGALTEEDAWVGASAVLITHEHVDHLDVDRTRQALEADPELAVWTNRSVAQRLDAGNRVRVVGAGDTFTAAGFDVEVHGEWHAEIHPDIPRVPNIGFFVDGVVFHPGDALTVPGVPVANLLLPLHAPWSRTGELIDYLREVSAPQAYPVHDGLLNDTGLVTVTGLVGERGPGTPTAVTGLTPGESVAL